ncbi:hypothetical protein EV361DRAFT_880813 [Lentinula raphanica]|uniref:Uncharacterized protein n=1 Tax=Lentinula raphanica TaxID=153919 RepID=A0AA38NZ72_9AGAR|nr:hypothetical protein F5880DRAFT_1539753 [Lentinula raphanica]KAJ3833349.1 hypothetical protein F5878DRAFT_632930 [Lentinula raphanica]KAJ3977053.1 hypothetical protein EV361DRAFT_880813 [Lentinula raphanica]
MESVLYGCHAAVFIFSLYFMRTNNPSLRFNPNVTVSVLVIMFILSTTHLCINFSRGMEAFVSYQDTPFGASVYLKQLWAKSNMAKQAVYVLNIVVGDSFALYRSYIILNDPTIGNCNQLFCKLLLLPACTLICSAACGFKSVHNLGQLPHSGANAFMREIYSFRIGLFAFSLFTNTFNTLLVVALVTRQIRQLAGLVSTVNLGMPSPYRKVCCTLFQFGTGVPASLITSLVLYSLKMNAIYIVLDSMSQIAGLASTAVVLSNYLPSIPLAEGAPHVLINNRSTQNLGKQPSAQAERNGRARMGSESSVRPLNVSVMTEVSRHSDHSG